MHRALVPVLASALTLVLASGRVGGAEVALVPSADTCVFAVAPSNSMGGSLSLAVGGNGKKQPGRGLIRFDITPALPAGATVTAARLVLQVTKDPGSAPPSSFHLHRLLVPWTEGRGTGNTGSKAAAGEVTWSHRSFPDTKWSADGGLEGVDYVATPSALVAMQDAGEYVLSGPGLVSDVQRWISDPASNQGWMLVSDLETTAFTARRVASREDAARAPSLILEFTTNAGPGPLDVHREDGRLVVGFAAAAGNVYEFQSREPGSGKATWRVDLRETVKLQSRRLTNSYALDESPARWIRVVDVADVD